MLSPLHNHAQIALAGDDYLRGCHDDHLEAIERALRSVMGQAEALRDSFREERKVLLANERQRLQQSTNERVKIYLPLNFFVRHHRGTFEMYWQEVHVRTPKTNLRAYKYLRRGKDGATSEIDLCRSAHECELELVLATERRAQQLRLQWQFWVRARGVARAWPKLCGGDAKAKEQAEVQADDHVLPDLIPAA